MKRPFRRRERPSEDVAELVYLPVAVASLRRRAVGTPPLAGPGSAEQPPPPQPGMGQRLFIVERVLGYGWAVSCDRASLPAADGDLPAGGGEAYGDGEPTVLPARLSAEECRRSIEVLASRALFAFGRGRVAETVELEPVHTARYPFRLRYRRKRSGAIDFDALDAVTGRRAGGPVRAAIAAALIDADRALASP